MLTSDELERYARHIVLRDFGGPGQQKLKAARVLVIGTGGLGAPAILYLAAAGIGTIGLVDSDEVSLSNLQRQVLFATADVGHDKVKVTAARIAALNPHVVVEGHTTRVNAENVDALVGGYDVVLDCTDNFPTRYAVSDACYRQRRALVMAAALEYDGMLTLLAPHLTGADGKPNPTYRCLFPSAPPDDLTPTCALSGVLGAVTGVLGSLQALEAIKWIAGVGEPLIGRLLLADTRSMRFETVAYQWNPTNPLNGTK